jgi:hypothetical protein
MPMEELLHALARVPLREQLAVFAGVVAVLALGFGFVGASIGAYFGGRIGARRAIGMMRRDPALLTGSQMDEVRNALDAIAVEVERISEGQRFTARLVSDRVGQGAAASGHRRDPGSITPH